MNLNDAQNEAVTSNKNAILVLAGAGSGKTRVLTERIGWLMQQGVALDSIMAVTFTNKAANEMRHRLEQKIGMKLNRMWLGTFHGLAHRFLRLHWQEAGFDQNFHIIDSEDQYRLIRRIQKELNLDEEKWPAKQAQAFINRNKDMCLRPQDVKPYDHIAATLLKVYEAYSVSCKRGNLIDFAELLLRTYEVLQEKPDILAHYKKRFHHILIDEFQDTNSLQYLWIKMLAQDSANLLVVGDDDQSIYSWRGAKVENIQLLINDFVDVHVVRLEQNYRSTSNILQAANAVIANNQNRMGKNLWTSGAAGELITLYTAYNETEEAKYVVKKIHAIKNSLQINKLCEVAILYRSNAQSRLFEEQLLYSGIPYRIYGGLRFFERAEIKDVLAYLRVMINVNDDAALERIINVPTRGIGETTLLLLRNYARQQQISLFAAIEEMIAQKLVAARAATNLGNFCQLLQSLQQHISDMRLEELTEHVIKTSGLHDYFAQDKNERNLMRTDNLEELVNAAKQFAQDYQSNFEQGTSTLEMLTGFLANASLEAGEAPQAVASDDCVQLMTLHSAKGLEFHTVFLCGLEEGLFPHMMSITKSDDQEEERRLCYVGITRARHKLYCTYAENRQWYGVTSFRQKSRFLAEIPEELFDMEDSLLDCRSTGYSGTGSGYRSESGVGSSSRSGVGTGAKSSRSTWVSSAMTRTHATKPIEKSKANGGMSESECAGFAIGQRVSHAKFGDGIIMDFEGQGEHLLIQIKFARIGSKWLSPAYAKLQTKS